MPLIKVNKFGGIRPQRGTDLLEIGEAVQATDVRLTGGELRPLLDRGSTLVTLNGAPQVNSIYRFGQSITSSTQFWFQSTADVDWVKGPVDADTTERTYWTDGTFPKKTDASIATSGAPYPSASYAMGLPAPASAPTLVVSGSPTTAGDPIEVVNYLITYVSPWGEEGPPSAATANASWQPGQTITLSSIVTSPGTGGAGQNYNVSAKRIYRAATGTQSTQYQFVAQIALATTTYADTTATKNLADVITTIGWLEPPPTMVGLCAGPNGIMAGFFSNTVCFSVPYVPYAWPVRYQQSCDAPVVGIAWFDQTLFVGTTQGIYLMTGADPANMTLTKLAAPQAVVSKRSVVPMMSGVMFASPDGLFMIDANGMQSITDGLMTRADWQAYVPTSIVAYESDNRYIAFYNTGSITGSLIFTFGSVPSVNDSTIFAFCGFRDRKQDTLFVVDASNQVKKFDAGSPLTYTWQSGVFKLPYEENMSAAMVDAAAYPVTFKLYADGALKFTKSVTNNNAFRLPAGYRSRRYQFSVSCNATVREVKIATSPVELTDG